MSDDFKSKVEKDISEALEHILKHAILAMRDDEKTYGFCGQCYKLFESDPKKHDDYDCVYCGSQNTIF